MRKIKELEQKLNQLDELYEKKIYNLYEKFDSFYRQTEKIIDNIKEEVRFQKGFCSELADKIDKQEKMLQEQEEFLQKVVCPFIAEKLANDLGDKLKGLGDTLADLFTEEPKQNKAEKKTTKKKESK